MQGLARLRGNAYELNSTVPIPGILFRQFVPAGSHWLGMGPPLPPEGGLGSPPGGELGIPEGAPPVVGSTGEHWPPIPGTEPGAHNVPPPPPPPPEGAPGTPPVVGSTGEHCPPMPGTEPGAQSVPPPPPPEAGGAGGAGGAPASVELMSLAFKKGRLIEPVRLTAGTSRSRDHVTGYCAWKP